MKLSYVAILSLFLVDYSLSAAITGKFFVEDGDYICRVTGQNYEASDTELKVFGKHLRAKSDGREIVYKNDDVTIFDASYGHNRLQKVPTIALALFKNLKEMRLEAMGLTVLEENSFKDGNKLEKILFAEDTLSIGADVFETCSNLAAVIFNENSIEKIDDNCFKGLQSLRVLKFIKNNIKSFTPELFSPLTGLTELVITNNPITSLHPDSFLLMANLKFLNLANNELVSFTSLLLRNKNRLEDVNLSNNSIASIDDQFLTNWPNNAALNLETNDCIDESYSSVGTDKTPLSEIVDDFQECYANANKANADNVTSSEDEDSLKVIKIDKQKEENVTESSELESPVVQKNETITEEEGAVSENSEPESTGDVRNETNEATTERAGSVKSEESSPSESEGSAQSTLSSIDSTQISDEEMVLSGLEEENDSESKKIEEETDSKLSKKDDDDEFEDIQVKSSNESSVAEDTDDNANKGNKTDVTEVDDNKSNESDSKPIYDDDDILSLSNKSKSEPNEDYTAKDEEKENASRPPFNKTIFELYDDKNDEAVTSTELPDDFFTTENSSTTTEAPTTTKPFYAHKYEQANTRFYADANDNYICVVNNAKGTLKALNIGEHKEDRTNDNVTIVYFHGSSLLNIPRVVFDAFPNVDRIWAENSGIKVMDSELLEVCGNLKELHLSNNKIHRVEGDSLKSCPLLETVDLTGNPVDRIESSIFECNPKLSIVLGDLKIESSKLDSKTAL